MIQTRFSVMIMDVTRCLMTQTHESIEVELKKRASGGTHKNFGHAIARQLSRDAIVIPA